MRRNPRQTCLGFWAAVLGCALGERRREREGQLFPAPEHHWASKQVFGKKIIANGSFVM